MWDEINVRVAEESDLPYVVEVLERVATGVVGPTMIAPAERYARMLQQARVAFDIAKTPTVFAAQNEVWVDCAIRYLVPARERRRWASALVIAVAAELAKPEHRGRIMAGYPRTRVDLTRE